MAETLLEKAQRLGIQPAVKPAASADPVIPVSLPNETLIQKAQRLGIKPMSVPVVPKAPVDFKGAGMDLITGNPIGALDKVTGNHIKEAVINGIPKVPALFKSNEGEGAIKTAAKTVGNLPGSALNFATGIIDFLNPVKNLTQAGKDIAQTVTDVAQYASDNHENPLTVLGKSLVSTSKTKIGGKNGLDVGDVPDIYKNALKAVTPKFIQDIVNGDFEGAKKSIVEHPVEEIGPLVLIAAGVAEKTGNKAAFDKAMKTISSPVIEPAKFGAKIVGEGLEAVRGGIENSVIKNAKSEWEKPTTKTAASYNKATDIYDKASSQGHDIADTLVKNKIKLQDNVQEGKYATSDTADKIRTDAAKASNELLRPALEEANASVERVPVQDVIDSTIKDIKRSKGTTAGDIEAQVNKATAEGEALLRKYPDGMNLTDIHDNRINYSSNGGYKFGDDPNTGNIKAVNRAFGRVLNDTLDETAPETIPVKEFRRELAKQYQSADYLDALNTKKVPTTILSRIAKTAAKVVGASAGVQLGGGVLGGVGGYHIGGMIESLIENMPNPIKSKFLDNLEKTNPEAFAKVSEALGQMQAEKGARLALPAPGDTVQREPDPIQLPDKGVLKGQANLKESTVYHGQGSSYALSRNPDNNMFGEGYYVSRNPEVAKQFGTVNQSSLPLKSEDIFIIHDQGEYQTLVEESIKEYPNLDVSKSIPKYVKKLGFKAIEGTPEFDPLAGINVFDKNVLKPFNKELPPLKSIVEGENKLYNKSNKSLPDQAGSKPNSGIIKKTPLKSLPKAKK